METSEVMAADVFVLAARLGWIAGYGPALAIAGMVVLVDGQQV
ncbi:MAG: hypothetical protein ABIG63_08730 [Chloroflexota bacterium]